MPTKKDRTPILPEKVYHIYNRGHNYKNTFFGKEDYNLFLKHFKNYLAGVSETYAFALLPNHYHFLLRINAQSKGGEFSNQFRKFILAYTNYINFREKRSGSLFLHPFKRIEITSEEYLKRLLFYIHYNPQKHEVSDNFKTYQFSSYPYLLSNKPTSLNRSDVFEIFGSKEDFENYHQYVYDDLKINKLLLEE